MDAWEWVAANSALESGDAWERLTHPKASGGCVINSEIVEIEEVAMAEVEVLEDVVEVAEDQAVEIEEITTDEEIEEISEESVDGIC